MGKVGGFEVIIPSSAFTGWQQCPSAPTLTVCEWGMKIKTLACVNFGPISPPPPIITIWPVPFASRKILTQGHSPSARRSSRSSALENGVIFHCFSRKIVFRGKRANWSERKERGQTIWDRQLVEREGTRGVGWVNNLEIIQELRCWQPAGPVTGRAQPERNRILCAALLYLYVCVCVCVRGEVFTQRKACFHAIIDIMGMIHPNNNQFVRFRRSGRLRWHSK